MNAIVEFREVGKRYGEKNVISGLNLSIHEGEFFVMVGPSGCGKTTTLKMINALTQPSEGDVYFNGKRIKDYDIRRLRHRIGIGQRFGLHKTLSAVKGIRNVKKQHMIHNDLAPHMEVDAQTYAVRANGDLLTCEPAVSLPMAQRYFLF